MKKIYLSGKISGLSREDYEQKFKSAGDQLLKENSRCVIVNPVEVGDKFVNTRILAGLSVLELSWSDYMRIGIKALMDCTHIAMLPNWKESKGAIVEHDLAKELGIEIIYLT